ncbi:MAG: transporter ATP-binding protein [Eubacterium sp.]|nr:transporter ATP-binding protein [Eubacterium sp.]
MSDKENKQQATGFQVRPGGGPGAMLHGTPVRLKNAKGTLRRLISYLSGQSRIIVFVFIFSIVSTLIGIAGTRLNGFVIDNYIEQKNIHGLMLICGLLLAIYLINVATAYLQNSLMIDVSQKTTAQIRKELFACFQRLPLAFFDKSNSGDLMSRLTNDVDNINITLSQNVTQLFSGVINIVGMLLAMLLLSPKLTLISLVTIPVMFFVTKFIAGITKRYFKLQQQNLGQLNGFVEEIISGQKVVKLFGREEKVKEQFNEINLRLKKSSTIAQGVSGLMGPLMNLINNTTFLIVAVAGGYLMLNGENITVGIIFTFLLYMRNFARPLNEIANLFNTIQSAMAGAERVFEIMDEPKEEDKEGSVELDEVQGHISFKDVTFSYVEGKPVLKNASIEAKQGEQIAIVGPTGAGKTTIISLLTRFYNIDSGGISIDGKDISGLALGSLRRGVGMVLQDTYLFSESVADNIRYGKPDATDQEVIAAARLANAHSFIKHMPQGYQTVLADNASNISQGQRQLIAIARAILADPGVLILDEATSSIDTRTELKIQEALLALMKGRTSFIIAHRLSTIKNADCILVIDNGSIVEKGTHTELLDQNGFYANLYNSQFKTGMAV